ncbi:hypothetical protein B0H14DRAFT_2650677 [Mycena olivaceomarginata]|nr:hypothetical protein B0H14DRAFT_2650677 [Mycena olivaceomarginata]
MFKSSLIFIFALAAMVTAQNGHPAATLSSPLQTGLNCHIGGIDCAFGGQVHACCSVNPITHEYESSYLRKLVISGKLLGKLVTSDRMPAVVAYTMFSDNGRILSLACPIQLRNAPGWILGGNLELIFLPLLRTQTMISPGGGSATTSERAFSSASLTATLQHNQLSPEMFEALPSLVPQWAHWGI